MSPSLSLSFTNKDDVIQVLEAGADIWAVAAIWHSYVFAVVCLPVNSTSYGIQNSTYTIT